MNDRSVQHGTFTIERIYPHPPARVFKAWSDPSNKARWFVGPNGWKEIERELDFRVGGAERVRGSRPDGHVSSFVAHYQDIVPNKRLIYAYNMHVDDRLISVSLACVEFVPADGGTRLIFTEQAAFLDGYDDSGSREWGTGFLLDQLGAALT